VHIYFPDPWPKKRHHKRRLIRSGFLERLHRVLAAPSPEAPDRGTVRIATDHADYFAWMEEAVANAGPLFERWPFSPEPEVVEAGELAGTNFERKFREEGRRFHGMILRKRPGPGGSGPGSGDDTLGGRAALRYSEASPEGNADGKQPEGEHHA
jgi:tRNA (guanine-N7-)-methyltransferase